MIDKVSCQDFKGQTFEYNIGQKTIITGPKGSGKSSISQAIQLSILGYIPSEKPKKRPMDIFSAFSSKNTKAFRVGVQQGKTTYTKNFRRAPSGSVSIKYVVGTGKYSEVDYKAALKSLPTPLDLSTFTSLSDQKKLDMLFELFPPAGNVIKMQADIDSCKDKISSTRDNIDSLKKTITRLSKARSELDLPSGTLADVRQEIQRIESEYRLTSQNISRAEAEDAEAKRQEDLKWRARLASLKEVLWNGQEAIDKIDGSSVVITYKELISLSDDDFIKIADAFNQKVVARSKPTKAVQEETEKAQTAEPIKNTPQTATGPFPNGITTRTARKIDIFDSIRAIMDTMTRAGCEACAATLVAKREMKRLKEVSNG
jgi:DNA repair exonuclease SbcCD ATPase subunit